MSAIPNNIMHAYAMLVTLQNALPLQNTPLHYSQIESIAHQIHALYPSISFVQFIYHVLTQVHTLYRLMAALLDLPTTYSPTSHC